MRTFVVYGTEREPALKLLTPSQVRLFYTRTMVTEKMHLAVEASFGKGFEHAIPAWDHAALRPIAESYEGPHEMRLKAICAAIILGIALEDLDRPRRQKLERVSDKKEDDGYRVPLIPPAPVKPAPALATP